MLDDYQKELLNGLLLGDGSLHISPNGKNANFRFWAKNKDHVEFVFNKFKNLCTDSMVVKHRCYHDKRTMKYYQSYYFNTKVNEYFTEMYNIWYTNKKKTNIPTNLELTKTILLTWYIDDETIKEILLLKNKKTKWSEIEKIHKISRKVMLNFIIKNNKVWIKKLERSN